MATDREDELARILLVQACEESDPEARSVSRREREAAGRAAREGNPPPERFVAARARHLAEALERRHASLRATRTLLRLRLPGLPVLLATAAAGALADVLGSQRRVNLLAFPLLGLLAWNVTVYAAFALGPLLARGTGAARGAGAAALLGRAAAWLGRHRPDPVAPEEARWLAASLRRFASLWSDRAGALLAARAQRLLHLGALGFALGVVGGMYARGLAFEYRAGWESTFLDAPGVALGLQIVLGPAAWIHDTLWPGAEPSARALLDARSIASLVASGGGGPAALWIHLWALTAALVIVLPRAALAWAAGRRARRLAGALAPPLDTPYYLRLRAPDRGAGIRIEVLPYSHRLSARGADALLELMHELFGNRAQVETREPLPYGAEPPAEAGARDPHARVLLFNLAQAPEQEVHGAFLEALRERHAASPRHPSLLVLLDEEPYRARFGRDAAQDRLGQRRRAWERIGRASDLRLAVLRPLDAEADEALAEARAALWPAAPGEAA